MVCTTPLLPVFSLQFLLSPHPFSASLSRVLSLLPNLPDCHPLPVAFAFASSGSASSAALAASSRRWPGSVLPEWPDRAADGSLPASGRRQPRVAGRAVPPPAAASASCDRRSARSRARLAGKGLRAWALGATWLFFPPQEWLGSGSRRHPDRPGSSATGALAESLNVRQPAAKCLPEGLARAHRQERQMGLKESEAERASKRERQ